jgi:hypothetical protein
MTSRILGLLATTAILAGVANAAVVQVDFGANHGTATDWNTMNDEGTLSGPSDIDGNTVDMTITVEGLNNSGRNHGAPAYDLPAGVEQDAFWVYADDSKNPSTGTIIIEVPDTVTEYTIEVFGATSQNSAITEWTLGTDTQTLNPATAYTTGATVKWTGVTAVADGEKNEITITADALGEDGFAWANAMTIVPEPATMSVLGLGGLVLLRRRKRA